MRGFYINPLNHFVAGDGTGATDTFPSLHLERGPHAMGRRGRDHERLDIFKIYSDRGGDEDRGRDVERLDNSKEEVLPGTKTSP